MTYKVEITDSTANKLEVSSSINEQNIVVEVIQNDAILVDVISNVPLLPSDFNHNVKVIVSDFLEAGYGVSLVPSGSYLLISATGLQPSGSYSEIGHSHNSSNIVDFNSSVSGLLPVTNILGGSGINISNSGSLFTVAATGQFGLTGEEVDDRINSLLSAGYGININYDDNNNLLTISTIGLQPSGNYSTVGHTHNIGDISGLQSTLDNKQPSGIYASGVHYHTSSDITDFSSSVSGLLPSISGLEYVSSTFTNNSYTISVSGLQPSGNYSLIGHSHVVSDITDFNSGVSGLLPVKNITGGSGISVLSSGAVFNIAVTGEFGLTSEQVDDRISELLVAGDYISLNYNDSGNLLTINASGLQPSGNYASLTHNHVATDITDFNSAVSGILQSGNIVSGVGSANFISKWANTNSLANSIIYDNGSNVGFGTSSPARNIDVVSSAGTSVGIKLNSTAAGGRSFSFFSTNNTSSLGGGKFGMYDDTAQASRFVIDSTGNIGIGTNNPAYKLDVIGSGNFSQNLFVNGVPVSISGHAHNSSDITNFASSVSGLLPSFTGISGVSVASSGNNYIISLNDPTIQLIDITDLSENARVFLLTPSSNNLQTLVSDTTGSGVLVFNNSPSFTGIPIVPTAPSGTNTDQIASTSFVRTEISNLVNSAPSTLDTLNELATALGNDPNFATTIASGLAQKSNIGHSHSSSDITDFNTSVSGLLPSVSGSGYVSSNFINNSYIISVSGLQPSGDYSLVGHSHNVSDITDFNTSVSGLLPVKDIIGSGYVNVSSLSGNYTVSISGLQPSGNYSIVGHSHEIADVSGLQNALDNKQPSGIYASGIHSHVSSDITDFNSSVSGLLPIKNIFEGNYISITNSSGDVTISATGLQPSGNYSLFGHSHTVSDITNFASGVSGLLPVKDILGTEYVNITSISGNYTIAISGLQPSGNYSVVGHSHEISDVSGLQNALDNKQPTGVYASGIHYHISSDITDFNTSVSGLLPSVNGSGYVNSTFINNSYVVSVSGLQPSGNYSVVGHTHTSSDITDFNTSVSGLIPVKNIVAGTGISVSSISGIFDISSTVNKVAEAESIVTTVFNKTSNTINKGSVVYINGGQGDQATIQLAIANGESGSSKTYGIVQANIPTMSAGAVVVLGALSGLNTDQYNPTAPVGNINGTTLWLSPTVSGAMTTTKPLAPNHMVSVGTVVRTHQNQGVIEVRIQNGFELYELHDVAVSGVTDGKFLQYNSASGLWIPSNSGDFSNLLVNGMDVSVSGHTHSSNNITDFSSSVSGLIPVTNILGGSNISVTTSGSQYTISVSGSLGLTTEEVDDRVANLLVAGSGISLNYNDNLNTLTINSSNIPYTRLSDTVSNISYIGTAPSGSLTSSNVWRIKRTTISSSGTVDSSLTATSVAWTDRLTASYT